MNIYRSLSDKNLFLFTENRLDENYYENIAKVSREIDTSNYIENSNILISMLRSKNIEVPESFSITVTWYFKLSL